MVQKLICAHTFVLAGYSARERWWDSTNKETWETNLGEVLQKANSVEPDVSELRVGGVMIVWKVGTRKGTTAGDHNEEETHHKMATEEGRFSRSPCIFGTAPFRQNANTTYRGRPQSSAAHLQTTGTQPHRNSKWTHVYRAHAHSHTALYYSMHYKPWSMGSLGFNILIKDMLTGEAGDRTTNLLISRQPTPEPRWRLWRSVWVSSPPYEPYGYYGDCWGSLTGFGRRWYGLKKTKKQSKCKIKHIDDWSSM